ncbi:MAG: hypothetical protein INH41_08705 [Myxococcaceae bacterium]|nr:hypothetical protein [Myxococcaceae bacterium]
MAVPWATRGAAGLVLALGLVGLAHAPPFRRELARAACPLGGAAAATPGKREAARVEALESRRGAGPAPRRDVTGLELGSATVDTAMARLGVDEASCSLDRPGLVRECRVGGKTLFLRTDESQRVVALASVEREPLGLAPRRAEALLDAWRSALGPPHRQLGAFDGATLGAGVLAQARAEWRFSDLVVSVAATRIDEAEVVVTLEAQALPPPSLRASR